MIIKIYFIIVILGNIVTFVNVLTMCHSWIHPLNHSPSSSQEKFQQVSFIHVHTYIHNILRYSPSYTLSLYHSHPISTYSPVMTCFDFLLCISKKWHYCLFKRATQGVPLWYFHICMYYKTSRGSSPLFFLFWS
jgi:hypothetical protein